MVNSRFNIRQRDGRLLEQAMREASVMRQTLVRALGEIRKTRLSASVVMRKLNEADPSDRDPEQPLFAKPRISDLINTIDALDKSVLLAIKQAERVFS